ncbi:apoptosis-inducing factor 2 [Pseudoscourfieldia marina]
MSGVETLQQICVVRNSDLPELEKRRTQRKLKAAGLVAQKFGAGGGGGGTSASDSEFGDDADGTDAASTVAGESETEALLSLADSALQFQSNALELEDICRDAKMEHAARRAATRRGIPEEAISYASQYQQALARASAAAPPGTSPARNRLLKYELLAIRKRYLGGDDSHFKLPVDADVIAAAARRLDAAATLSPTAADAEHALTSALLPLFNALASVLKPVVLDVRKSMARGASVVPLPRNIGESGGNTRIVIVGGGSAGAIMAKKFDLMDNVHLTLVDPKDFFEEVTMMPKSIVYPGESLEDTSDTGYWPRSVVPYKGKVVTNGRVVTAPVAAVRRTHIEVGARRSVVPYDILILATGCRYSSDIRVSNPSLAFRHRQITTERDVIAASRDVLVIGGGLVGCEISGDIAEKHGKDINVTLVQGNRSGLCPRIPNAHEKCKACLEGLGVNVIIGERVVEFNESAGMYTTDTGRVIKADKVYTCTGNIPNTNYLQKGSGSDEIFTESLDRIGYLRVDKHLRVGGLPNVFAVGDMLSDASHMTDHKGIADRRAQTAGLHAYVASTNAERLTRGEELLLACDERKRPFAPTSAISLGITKGMLASGDTADSLAAYGVIFTDEEKEEFNRDHCIVHTSVQGVKSFVTGAIVNDASADYRASEMGAQMLMMMQMQNPTIIDLAKGERLREEEASSGAPAPAAEVDRQSDHEAAAAKPSSEMGDGASETASVLESRYKESLHQTEVMRMALEEERTVAAQLRGSLSSAEDQVRDLMARMRKLETDARDAEERASVAERARGAPAALNVNGSVLSGGGVPSDGGSSLSNDVILANLLQTQVMAIAQLVGNAHRGGGEKLRIKVTYCTYYYYYFMDIVCLMKRQISREYYYYISSTDGQ